MDPLRVKAKSSTGVVEVTTKEGLQTTVDTLAQASSGKRLCVIISNSHIDLELKVPADFTSLEICSASRNNVNLKPISSYCSIPLTAWNQRRTYATHELTIRSHVYLEVPDYEFPSADVPPPFAFQEEEDAPAAAASIKATMEPGATMLVSSKQSAVLPWLAAGAGVAASGATAGILVSSFEFGAYGAYVSCVPLTAGAFSVAGVGSRAAAGAATLGAGIGVAAAVYFIPWSKLVKWAANAWDLFMVFIKSVWSFFKKAWNWFVSFLKVLIRAQKDFMTHFSNAFSWGSRLLLGAVMK